MFGIVITDRKSLSEEARKRYQSFYCGICLSLGGRYGRLEQLALSYDMTFLAIFLSSMYEPIDTDTYRKCPYHISAKKNIKDNKFIQYAADMTVVMAYYKGVDDWEDERSKLGKLYSDHLKEDISSLEEKYPRQCAVVKEGIARLTACEKDSESEPDEAIKAAGYMLSELFAYEEDFFASELRRFGYELGRYIYLCDAAIDYNKDLKKHSYNPIVCMQKSPAEVKNLLEHYIARAAASFERLPMVQDEEIIRNVLYKGIWLMYNARAIRKQNKVKGDTYSDS